MFYFSDIKPSMRRLLDDEYTPYRFREDELREYSLKAVKAVYKDRPDSRIDDSGDLREDNTAYNYTDSYTYLNEYDRIQGWDRYNSPIMYLKQTATDTISIYTSAADRTGATNEVATVTDADSVGIKSIREANSSTWDGSIQILEVAALNDEWTVEATENAYELDDIFREAVINWSVARCYEQDNADTYSQDKVLFHTKNYFRELA